MGNSVSLCMICKNEKNNMGGLLDDTCPVLEEVVVVDTGSTDGTLEILKEKQKQYPNLRIEHFEWVNHFSKARNYSFSLASPKADWILWLDGDDRVDREKLRRFKDEILDDDSVDAWMLDYVYSTLPDGSPQTILGRERFLRSSKRPRWTGAIHETVDIGLMRQKYCQDLQIIHNHRSKVIEPKRNLKILEKEFEKNPKDARTAYYYGKELFDHVDPKSEEVLEHYLTLPGRYYDDECNARSRLARSYLHKKKHREALKCIDEVYHLDITRKRADYYFIYGAVEEDLGNYEIAAEWFKRCLMKPPEGTRVLTMEFYTWHPRKRLAECCMKTGDWNSAFDYARQVLEILPGDKPTEEWHERNFRSAVVEPRGGHRLTTLEFGTAVRYDSYRVRSEEVPAARGDERFTMSMKDPALNMLPLAENSLDGIVAGSDCQVFESELIRAVKPGGFIWSEKKLIGSEDGLSCLGVCGYQKTRLWNYVKIDPDKPIIAYRETGGEDFAPYRYRITNLLQSARKNGFRVVRDDSVHYPGLANCDICVSLNLNGFSKNPSTTYILEVTEQLPDYSAYGIDKADVVNASSPMLAQHIRQTCPGKKVVNVDDHFEVPAEGWL
jgi:glycosyltransferase involved in cell wall biosynthesis